MTSGPLRRSKFFDDAARFEDLERRVIPNIFSRRRVNGRIRVWSVDAGAGEDAYSLGMLLAEQARRHAGPVELRILVSDQRRDELAMGRRGFYGPEIEASVSSQRLSDFFNREIDGYRVRDELRSIALFGQHNLFNDPPFSHLDLISYRGPLADSEPAVQRKIIELMHYALGPGGALLLDGSLHAEFEDLFQAENQSLNLLRKHDRSRRHFLGVFPIRTEPGDDVSTSRLAALVGWDGRGGELARDTPLDTDQLQTTVEELQSTLEELEVSREELQTANEELRAAAERDRLHLQTLTERTTDLQNLLSATESATLLLDDRLHILRFTRKMERLFSLVASDRGRPLSELRGPLSENDLRQDFENVLGSLVPLERDVQDAKGNRYLMRVRPYRTAENKIDGIIVTLIDVTRQKRAEENLRASEQRFRALVNASSDLLFRMNPDWTEMRQLSATGFFSTSDGPRIRWLDEQIPSEEQPRVLAKVQEVIRDKSVFELEHRVRQADGTTGWSLTRAVPLSDASGNVTEWFGAATDITERRRNAEALRRLASIVQNSDDAILSKSLDGVITTWNAAAERMFGYTEAEAVGQPVTLIVPPEVRSQEADILARIRAGEDIAHFETKRLRKDGSTLDISLTISPVRDSDGQIVGSSTIAHDVSERRRMEQALRDREEDLRSIFDLSAQVPWTADPDGKILDYSGRGMSLTGRGRDELLGEGWLSSVHPDDLQEVAKAWQRAVRAGETYDVEYRLRMASGEHRWVRTRAYPRRDASGRIVKWYGTTEDIHQRRLAEQQAREMAAANRDLELRSREIERANQLKSEFLTSMSHELRTPLHTILGFTELLTEKLVGELNAKQEKFLRNIHADAGHLLTLINGILDLSKIEAGRVELNYEVLDLKICIADTVNAVRARAAAESVTVEDRTVGPIPGVRADSLRVKQILYNLLGNAIKFTPEGGHVWVEAFAANNLVTVKVGDTGIGIPPEQQEKIFDKFHQIGHAASGVREGTGLGLAITKQLVELHGGSIWVESVPGRGSEFSFSLPLNREAAAARNS